MAGLTSAEILDEAALLLNDSAKITFGYAITAPWLKRAVNELSDELAVNSIPLLRKVTSPPIAIAIGATIIPLPADALVPIFVEERSQGSTLNFSPMVQLDAVVASATPSPSLGFWAFQGTLLNSVPVLDTPGATTNRDVKITYERFLPYVSIDAATDFSTSITFPAKRFLSAKVAQFVATFILQNDRRAKELKDECAKSLFRIVQIWVKFKQNTPVRKSRYAHPNPESARSSPLGSGGGGSGDLTNVAFLNLLNIFTQHQRLSGINPSLEFNETDAGVDLKNWAVTIESNIFLIQIFNDLNVLLNNVVQLTRSGDLTVSGLLSTLSGTVRFPGTQIPSGGVNDLDDYEEGSWTPALAFGGSSVGITYGSRVGIYTKIGNRVCLDFAITLTSKGAAAGAATLTGIPFSAGHNPVGILDTTAPTFAALTSNPHMSIFTSTIQLLQFGATGSLALTNANFTNASSFLGTIIYKV